jgi:hypothetical protein
LGASGDVSLDSGAAERISPAAQVRPLAAMGLFLFNQAEPGTRVGKPCGPLDHRVNRQAGRKPKTAPPTAECHTIGT